MDATRRIGHRIRQLREAKNLSKSELARRCNVSTTAVWNWEENGIVPRAETFTQLASALGVKEAFLRFGDSPEEQSPSSAVAPRSVATIIQEAREEIAFLTGMDVTQVTLNVEFSSK